MVGKHFRTATVRRLFSSTALSHYRRDEGGSFIIFSLFIFMVMIMIGGLAIDIMRYENLRTKMQNTIDRAVLAASDLDLDPSITAQDVVDDYLAKAGMGDLAYTVDVEESTVGDDVIGRTVFVTSNARMDTYFMHLMGATPRPFPCRKHHARASNHEIEIRLVGLEAERVGLGLGSAAPKAARTCRTPRRTSSTRWLAEIPRRTAASRSP